LNFTQYLEKIENCQNIHYLIGDLTIIYHNDNYLYYSIYIEELGYYQYLHSYEFQNYNEELIEFLNENLRKINHIKKGSCNDCNPGFLLIENKCVPIKIENCSLSSMITENNIYYRCREFCKFNRYPLVILNINKINNESSYSTLSEIYDEIIGSSSLLKIDFESLLNHTLCLNNSENFKNCLIAKYLENENKYVCHLCDEGYFLNEETNKCINYYKDILPLYGFESSKAKLRLFIKREFNLTMGQASLFASDVLKLIQKM
jgi:hypothetical protein